MLAEAGYYLRMAAGLARYQLSPLQADPVEAVQEQFQHREERFLAMARYALGQKDHLYAKLFEHAGCTYADLESGVRNDGLRSALARLAEAGVYVTHDEFRGRKDVVRGRLSIPWHPRNWENPRGRGWNVQSTSGSTGQRFITSVSNEYLLYREWHEALDSRSMNLRSRPRVIVGSILPSTWPIRRQVTWHRLGIPADRWFALGETNRSYRMVTRFMIAQIQLLGASAVHPEYLPPNDFEPVVRCLARFRAEGRPACVRTMVSLATRIAGRAQETGLDISGTVFSVSGEPLTPIKRSTIEAAGASVQSFWGATEFGPFGFACEKMRSGDCVHLFEDAFLLTPAREMILITSSLPFGPRIVINVGIDDSAVIEPASCDCEYQRLGFTMQARSIFSYGKVTSQGVTMAAADLASILESALPKRFAASPGDFQLAEIEGASQSEVVLRVSARVREGTPEEIREFFLKKIGGVEGGSLSQRLWGFSGGLRVVVEEPEATSTGKVHPVRLRSF